MNLGNVIYIAGPMKGYRGFNRDAFSRAEKELRDHGWKVLNPGILPLDLPGSAYMPICLAMLREANAVYMLRDWEYSEGAALEHAYAEKTEKAIIYETGNRNAPD